MRTRNAKTGATIAVVLTTAGGQPVIFDVLNNGSLADRFTLQMSGSINMSYTVADGAVTESGIAFDGVGLAQSTITHPVVVVAGVATDGPDLFFESGNRVIVGTPTVSSNDSAGAFPNTNAGAIIIGNTLTDPTTGPGFDGDIGELVFYTRALNTKERRRLLEYLSAKWGTP